MRYDELIMLPHLNGVTIIGDKSLADYGLVPITAEELTEIMMEIFGYVL